MAGLPLGGPAFFSGLHSASISSLPPISEAFISPFALLKTLSKGGPVQEKFVGTQQAPKAITLPDFLQKRSLDKLSPVLRQCTQTEPAPTAKSILDRVPQNAWSSIHAPPLPSTRIGLNRISPALPVFSAFPALSRPACAPFKIPAMVMQRRTFMGLGTSRNVLANLEESSNRNMGNPSTQATFYSALLRSDMPEIVVQRYESGRFASNKACETLYMKALERLGRTEQISMIKSRHDEATNSTPLSREEVQAIAQAVGANSYGSTVSVSNRNFTSGPNSGNGQRDSPLYVVVEETKGSRFFKWARFLLIFGFVTYFSMIFVTVFMETAGVVRKIGGQPVNEAQPQQQTVKFSDVHGCDEAKEELQELVEFLKDPSQFTTLGGKLPKGVLLTGPPGTGKTLLARAVAGEAGVPFFFMSGSEFDEVYVGVGAKRVRELFANARAKSPAIIFIDELDAIGGKRKEKDYAHSKQTLNQLLVDLDGFSPSSGVIILAATNFPELLDNALTRPGRFDRQVVVPLPDAKGRTEILKHYMKDVRFGPNVDPSLLARGTPGFSGAELENLVNQAAVRASRNRQPFVFMEDFEWAKDKIMMGAERRSAIIPPQERKMTAYHEGGHTIVALFTEGHTPVYKVTIMPRGQALGLTHYLPDADVHSVTKKQYLSSIDSALGGKIAEELIYGPDNVTSGCSSDLVSATRMARNMVTRFGMSDALGDVNFSEGYNNLSPQTKEKIELEVRKILDEARARATNILIKHRKELDRLAEALVEYESLDKDEIRKVIKGEKLTGKVKLLPNVPTKIPETSGILPVLDGTGGGEA